MNYSDDNNPITECTFVNQPANNQTTRQPENKPTNNKKHKNGRQTPEELKGMFDSDWCTDSESEDEAIKEKNYVIDLPGCGCLYCVTKEIRKEENEDRRNTLLAHSHNMCVTPCRYGKQNPERLLSNPFSESEDESSSLSDASEDEASSEGCPAFLNIVGSRYAACICSTYGMDRPPICDNCEKELSIKHLLMERDEIMKVNRKIIKTLKDKGYPIWSLDGLYDGISSSDDTSDFENKDDGDHITRCLLTYPDNHKYKYDTWDIEWYWLSHLQVEWENEYENGHPDKYEDQYDRCDRIIDIYGYKYPNDDFMLPWHVYSQGWATMDVKKIGRELEELEESEAEAS